MGEGDRDVTNAVICGPCPPQPCLWGGHGRNGLDQRAPEVTSISHESHADSFGIRSKPSHC